MWSGWQGEGAGGAHDVAWHSLVLPLEARILAVAEVFDGDRFAALRTGLRTADLAQAA